MNKPSDPSPSPSPFESPVQEAVYERLRELVSPAIADLYHDACEIRSGEPPLRAPALILGHLFREIDGAVRDALTPAQFADGEGVKIAHIQNIKLILKDLDVEIDNERIALWFKFADKNNPWQLYKFAHRHGLGSLRKYDDDFVSLCSEFDSLLDFVLDRLEAGAAKIAHRLDERLAKAPPAIKHVKRLFREHLPNAPFVFDRLFERPLSDAWIDALLAAGFFADPPPAAVQAASYFARELASRDIERSARILESLPKILDPFMLYNYLTVVTLLPLDRYAPLVEKLKAWITATEFGTHQGALSPRFGPLLRHQASCGDALGAIELLSLLTELHGPVDGESLFLRKPLTRVDVDDYDELVRETIEGVASAEPVRLITLLCDRLNTAIQVSLHVAEIQGPRAQDVSDSWLPGLGAPHGWFDLKPVLGQRIYHALHRAADAGFAFEELAEPLRAHRFLIFDRLMLDLLLHTGANSDRVKAILTDASRYEAYPSTSEFVEFVHTFFPSLDAADRAAVEQLMFSQIDRNQLGDDLTEAELHKFDEINAMNFLATAETTLTPQSRAELLRLTKKHGPQSTVVSELHPIAMAIGPDSPFSDEQFEKMRPDEIATWLARWTPPPADLSMAHPAGGVALQLKASVGSRPEAFAAELSSFVALDPIYIEHLVSGFEQPLRSGHKLPWRPIIDFLRHVASNADAVHVEPSYGAASWSQTRRSICSLIIDGMSGHFDPIPLDCADTIFQIIAPVTTDSNPSSDDPQSARLSPWHRAVSSTRAMAARALVRYAIWSHDPSLSKIPLSERDGIRRVPAVAESLERMSRDGSDTVLSVFGGSFRALCDLDLTWASAIAVNIFPASTVETPTNFSAWRSFIEVCGVNAQLFSLLAPCYEHAVRTWPFPEDHDAPHGHSYPERLAEHSLLLFVNGVTSLDALLVPLYDRLSAEAAGHGILHLARIVHRLPGSSVPPEIEARIREFWSWRSSVFTSNPGAHGPEIESFGQIFYVGKLDEGWRLDGLEIALTLTNGRFRPDHKVMEALPAVSDAGLPKALNCLDQIVRGRLLQQGITSWNEHMREILGRGLSSPRTEQQARDIVGRLIARRSRGFDSLIPKRQEDVPATSAPTPLPFSPTSLELASAQSE